MVVRFQPDLAEIRFGCGLSPVVTPPESVAAMLAGLGGPDHMAERFPIETMDGFRQRMLAAGEIRKRMKQARGTPEFEAIRKEYRVLNKIARQDMLTWLGQGLLRRSHTASGFRERLAFFWGDHFTAQGKRGLARRATSPHVEAAIRPHLTGRFADLLVAGVTSPLMLDYLDQVRSVGPASARAIKSGGKMGLNENLAREVLELHTLGVDGPYTQEDVRQLAELFTGLSFQPQVGFKFRKDFAEPGAETVLGRSYGGDPARLEHIRAVLEDLAAHPATAAHICRKLAVHFVADAPDPDLVAHMTGRYRATGGELAEVYAAMLEHPAAWEPALRNVKLPVDFVGSTCRALAVDPSRVAGMTEQDWRRLIVGPMALMGQVWQKPAGPDGWPEADAAWITPQGLAARMRWAMAAPARLVEALPDPRDFVRTALGSYAEAPVVFAAGAAETRAEAIGLVLSSPAFQRR